MSQGVQFLLATSLVYFGVDILAVWGLNLQFGVTGILNFAFVLFQAIGAYIVAVLTLGPASGNGGYQQYILGAHLPFLVALFLAGLTGAAVSIPIGLVALRRLRADYQAIALLVVSIIGTIVVVNTPSLFNGSAGLASIPRPWEHSLNLSAANYQWFYVALVAAICLLVYVLVIRPITGSPIGRALRAIRDNEPAAAALGKRVLPLKLFALAVGGGIGAVSGGLLAPFILSWAPSAWNYPETFVLIGAIIIGGKGNNFGVVVGALLFPVLISEGSTFLPAFGSPALVPALQWVISGLLILLFLWFRPEGIVPERKRLFPATAVVAEGAFGRMSKSLRTEAGVHGAGLDRDA